MKNLRYSELMSYWSLRLLGALWLSVMCLSVSAQAAEPVCEVATEPEQALAKLLDVH